MTKLWDGRFSKATAEELEKFSQSISFDKRLYNVDLDGSVAHAKMLHSINLISSSELDQIIKGLKTIREEIQTGKFSFDIKYEDIHMAIEFRLIELIGDAGKKLHTARSRNDQVALDTRMYCSVEVELIKKLILNLKQVFVSIAENNINTVMPGYTHMQRAQIISLAHHMMAYYSMFRRDYKRLNNLKERILEEMPLGSGALAGSTINIDRYNVCENLFFKDVSQNSLDSVSDRDYVIEFNSTCAIIMVHLSRLSEELILWNTKEFSFIEIEDNFTTGSSMMPQKKNPDIPELVKGKSARVIGNLMQILTLIKGTPLAYNRDFQEDKESLFDTIDTTKQCLSIIAAMLENTTFNSENLKNAVKSGFLNATEAMEYLVKKGLPNRDAHKVIGKAVAYCIYEDKQLEDLTKKDWITIEATLENYIENDITSVLQPENCLKARNSTGGPSPEFMKTAIARAKVDLEKLISE